MRHDDQCSAAGLIQPALLIYENNKMTYEAVERKCIPPSLLSPSLLKEIQSLLKDLEERYSYHRICNPFLGSDDIQ